MIVDRIILDLETTRANLWRLSQGNLPLWLSFDMQEKAREIDKLIVKIKTYYNIRES